MFWHHCPQWFDPSLAASFNPTTSSIFSALQVHLGSLESSHSPAALHHPQVTPVLQSLAIWTTCSHFPGLHLNFSWSLHTGRPLRSPRRLSLCDTRLHFNCSLSSCYAVISFSELWHIDYCVSRTIRCYRHIDSPVIFPETTSRKIQLPSTDFFGMLVSILKLRTEFF